MHPSAGEGRTVGKDEAGRQTPSVPKPDEIALLIGIRRGERKALCEFMRRFQPLLLDQARRLGTEPQERDNVITAFLDDIALKLAHMQAPRSLSTFIIKSFRNHVADAWRADDTRLQRDTGECDLIGGERVVSATCSAFAIRATLGPDAGGSSTTVPAATLMNAIMRGCTREERSLLVWSSQRVPMRDIAEWLGISYGAARQRIARLRARLAHESIQHLVNLDPADRAVITRLLRRAGVKIDEEIDDGGQTGGAAA